MTEKKLTHADFPYNSLGGRTQCRYCGGTTREPVYIKDLAYCPGCTHAAIPTQTSKKKKRKKK